MKGWLLMLLGVSFVGSCAADCFVVGPTPAPGPIVPPAYRPTVAPFFIMQAGWNSMRYQQAYSASLFSNVAGECIYVTSFRYEYYPQTNNVPDTSDWTMRLQINLSTTQRSVDDLSVNFSENVGLDDTVVFGPTRIDFKSGFGKLLFFDQPFRYGLFQGNLLLDVRVWDASGTIGFGHIDLEAQDSSTDEVSRVWATNVAATVASGVDTTGLLSAFQFTPVPALQIEVRSVFGTNRPVLSWPAQPSVFVPQTSAQLGNNAVWQTITNGILGSPEGPDRAIYLTTPSAGTSGFFRLLWQSGQPVQLSIVPDIPANPREGSQTK